MANNIADFCEALGVRARPRAAFGSQHRNVQKAIRRRIALESTVREIDGHLRRLIVWERELAASPTGFYPARLINRRLAIHNSSRYSQP
jgi:hypothetical protein